MPRDRRSEAQPRRVQESRGDDCINRKTKWAALEALVGDPKRIALVAADLVAHLTPSPPAQSGFAQRFALSEIGRAHV